MKHTIVSSVAIATLALASLAPGAFAQETASNEVTAMPIMVTATPIAVTTTVAAPVAKQFVITVGPAKKACTGVAPMECLQVAKGLSRDYQNFYSSIEGFDYQAGYTYRLKVKVVNLDTLPADASHMKYTLVRVISKKALSNTQWEAVSLNGTAVSAGGTLNFKTNTLGGKLCNTYGGSFTAKDGKLNGVIMSTKMYCDSDLMKVEDALDFQNVAFAISNNGETLTLTTKAKDSIVWKRKK